MIYFFKELFQFRIDDTIEKTDVSGNHTDTSRWGQIGSIEGYINRIRKQLGANYGQRMIYQGLILIDNNKESLGTYLPFGKKIIS